jgi:hypothetical protein
MSTSSVRPGTQSHDQSQLLHNLLGCEQGCSAESLTDSLVDRVERLLHPSKPLEWGHPLVSTTPTSVAIDELTRRTEALENALREIAAEVRKLSDEE